MNRVCWWYYSLLKVWSSIWSVWQQLELAFELEFDLWDTVDLGRKWLVHFQTRKTQLVSFDQSDNTGTIDVGMDGSVFEEKSSLRCWGWLSFLNWIGALTLSLLLKVAPRELEPWFVLWSFCLLGLLFIRLPYNHGLNTVISRLVLLVATGNC